MKPIRSRTGARRPLVGVLAGATVILAAACGDATGDAAPGSDGSASPNADPTPGALTPDPSATPESSVDVAEEDLLAFIGPNERAVGSALTSQGWDTDFTRFAADLDVRNLSSGGVPRDGIASIDSPNFAPVSEPPDYMRDEEPVIVLEVNGDVRGYPLSIMTFHEIVNDTVGGVPVTVTFCPLCNTSLVFPRTLENGTVLDFGVSGFLQNSDLIMYDRQSESLWQQITGRGLIGTYAAVQLEFLPVAITGWAEFSAKFPDGQILLRPTADERHEITGRSLARDYSRPPYPGYDDINSSPFLYRGPLDGRLLPVERIASVTLDEFDVAYPYSFLGEQPVINDVIGSTPITVFFDNGTESAFTSRSGEFSKSGSTTVFDRRLDGRVLTFDLVDGEITDVETGSNWDKFGNATSGELAGTRLEPITHAAHFWFAWAAFKPETEVRGAASELTAELVEVESPG